MLPTRDRLGTVAAMARSSRRPGTWPLLALVAWSAYVWSTRIGNAAGDANLSSGAKAFSIGLSVTFIGFAVAGLGVLVRAWSRSLTSTESLVLKSFAAWTALVWLVRVPMILLDGHSVPFKLVHAVLGLISIGLAVSVWRSTSATAASDPADESLPAPSAR
jgi:hypothetical protein